MVEWAVFFIQRSILSGTFFLILHKIITNKRIQSGAVLIKTQMRGAGVEPANACATGP